MDTIASLLERADSDQTGEEERETAMRMAEQLGAKYSIEFATARLHANRRGERPDKVVQRSVQSPKGGSTWTEGYAALAYEMAEAFDLPVIWRNLQITFYGRKFDVELLVSLFHRLVLDQESKADRAVRERGKNFSAQQARASFRYGYRRAVRERLEALREESAEQLDQSQGLASGTTAIALRDRNAQMWSEAEEEIARTDLEVARSPFSLARKDRAPDSVRSGDKAGREAKLFADRELDRGGRELNRG